MGLHCSLHGATFPVLHLVLGFELGSALVDVVDAELCSPCLEGMSHWLLWIEDEFPSRLSMITTLTERDTRQLGSCPQLNNFVR